MTKDVFDEEVEYTIKYQIVQVGPEEYVAEQTSHFGEVVRSTNLPLYEAFSYLGASILTGGALLMKKFGGDEISRDALATIIKLVFNDDDDMTDMKIH